MEESMNHKNYEQINWKKQDVNMFHQRYAFSIVNTIFGKGWHTPSTKKEYETCSSPTYITNVKQDFNIEKIPQKRVDSFTDRWGRR